MGLTAKDVMAILKENGWECRGVKGSHHIFTKNGFRSIPVPLHGGNKDLGVFANRILKEAGISRRK
ncbi:MAG: type II toxin-antitoxin system HicA family toxin [Chitinivibrionia bacterium]|nr:type II toxin-antitoxin system HicA family toxin [Chitinivibrionia bacterium]